MTPRGGKRENAGRPATGRRRRQLYITDEEYNAVQELIKKMREQKDRQ